MIYLDSCALVKLIRCESESAVLQSWLDERGDELAVTSELARTEVMRVVRRNNHTDGGRLIDPAALQAELDSAADLLAAVSQLVVDADVLDRAGALALPMVRTLDAIHLVSAAQLGIEGVEFVTYDAALARAAEQIGLTVRMPR